MSLLPPIHTPRLSVHAWERYCERFGWEEFGAVSARLIQGAARAAIAAGATRVTIGSVVAVCDAGLIVTVYPTFLRDKNKHGRRRRCERNRLGLKRRKGAA